MVMWWATVDGKLTCSGDSNCAAWNNVASVTVNGGYAPITLLPSLSAMTGTSTWIPGAATISRGPTQPPPLKPGCTVPALVAGAKAAGSDFAGGPPGANPGSDVADLCNFQERPTALPRERCMWRPTPQNHWLLHLTSPLTQYPMWARLFSRHRDIRRQKQVL